MDDARKPLPNQQLKRARERRCWSQEQMAERIGTTRVNVSRWEHGLTFPGPHFRQQLCALFEVSADELGLIRPAGEGAQDSDAPGDAGYHDGPAPLDGAATPIMAVEPQLPVAPPPLANHGLVGRDELLAHLSCRLCAEGAQRLAALYGLPGVGKTALAATLAHTPPLQACFPDGVLWAGLGPTPNVLRWLGGWGTALGLTSTEMARLTDVDILGRVLQGAIGMRRFLLIVDDAWALEDALAFQVGGPHCAHLVTTRFPDLALRIAGDGALAVEELSEDEGLVLLALLAPGVVSAERDGARTLVHSAGGLPLALTLMGRYLQVHAHGGQPRRVHAALARLQDAEERLRLAEPCAAVDRPPSLPDGVPLSLWAAIAVSDQWLDETARRALRALAAFPAKPNSFSEDAALAVAAAPPQTLDALADAGLLESAGPGRYTVHQTVTDYARLQRLDRTAYERLAAYFVAYVEHHSADYPDLECEASNILAALEAAFEHGQATALIHGANGVAPFLLARGLYDVAERHLTRAEQAAITLGHRQDRARACLYLGHIAELRGDLMRADQIYQDGLTIADAGEDPTTVIALLTHQGEMALQRGDYGRASVRLKEGLELARAGANQGAIAVLLRLSGEVTDCLGQFVQATALYEEGLALARTVNDHEAISALVQNLGYKASKRGDDMLAEQLYEEGLEHARAIGHRQRTSALLNNLGMLAYRARRYEQAERLYQESLDLARMIEHRLRMSSALQNLGMLARERGELARAAGYFRESLDLARALGNPFLFAETLNEWGALQLAQHQLELAEATFSEALATASAVSIGPFIGAALYGLARIAAARDDLLEARRLGQESLQHFDAEDEEEAEAVTRWLAALPPGNSLE